MKQHYIRSQQQISFVKEMFSRQLAQQLGLMEVQAPILSRVGDGTQDNLSGHENAVQVKVKTLPEQLRSGPFTGQMEAPNPGSLRVRPG